MAADRLNKRVLLTGASGFVGRHCARHLESRGWEVHAQRVDLLNPSETSALIRELRPDALLHLAWYSKHRLYWTADENFDWLNASLHLLREFTAAGGKRFVGAGTCAEYDWSVAGHCDEATTPSNPATVYGACKYALHLAANALCRKYGVSYAWGRLFFLYGPDEHPERFVPSVVGSLLRSETARCTSGEQIRDFLHVDDAASALAALLGSDIQGVVNIASGTAVPLRDIARTIARVIGREDLLALGALPMNANDPPVLTAATGRLRNEVGWTPSRTLRQGLEQTIDWWRAA
jgi:nucleoside-diphosphate-sugar epimerase